MKKRIISIFTLLIAFVVIFTGCAKKDEVKQSSSENNKKIVIVTTTTMLKDLIENIGGDKVVVEGLMGEGVDPHLYKPTASDVDKLKKADVVIYQGLHLEGQMGEIFSELKDKKVIEAAKGMDKSKIIKEEGDAADPHIWFDPTIWSEVGNYISKELSKFYPEYKNIFEMNYEKYGKELLELDRYIQYKISVLTEDQKALVTAHDAFSYFEKKYSFDVLALQGVSTESEATTKDIDSLADKIVQRNIKAIFVESSVPEKTIKALQETVKSKGHSVEIGPELYSDSLGDKESNTETYIKTFKQNVDNIVNSLK